MLVFGLLKLVLLAAYYCLPHSHMHLLRVHEGGNVLFYNFPQKIAQNWCRGCTHSLLNLNLKKTEQAI